MAITFVVDDVDTVRDRLETRPGSEVFASALGAPVAVTSHQSDLVVDAPAKNGLVAAVHRAFSDHRPLSLSPDAVWLTLSQGFGHHVNNHAEALRDRLVRHRGRAVIGVPVESMPQSAADWTSIADRFGDGIAEHVGPGLVRLLRCDFSTTTAIARTASDIAMMSGLARYFDYRVYIICGLPTVTLEGTADDWRRIRERVDVLAEYDLEWWIRWVRPICDELVATAEGSPDRDFWQCVHMPKETYGTELITGWLARLFPYVQDATGQVSRRNPIVDVDSNAAGAGRERWIHEGISIDAPPTGLSEAPVELTDMASGEPRRQRVRLVGGLVGVRQDNDGAIAPEIGWGVTEPRPMAALLDRMEAEHRATPSVAGRPTRPPNMAIPAELVELYDRFAEVTMFDRWRVRPETELERMVVTAGGDVFPLGSGRGERIVRAVDLADDHRWLGLADIHEDDQQRFAVVLVEPGRPFEELYIVADSVLELFEQIVDAGGALYFDDPGFEPRGAWYDGLPDYSAIRRDREAPVVPAPALDVTTAPRDELIQTLWRKDGTGKQLHEVRKALSSRFGLGGRAQWRIRRHKGTFEELLDRLELPRTPYDSNPDDSQ